MNKVTLTGRITRDPEARVVGESQCVNFTLAVNRKYKNKEGVREADFINCVIWGNAANFMTQYVKKGHLLAVEGHLQTRQYEDSEFEGRMVYVTEVRVDSVEDLTPRDKNAEAVEVEEAPKLSKAESFAQLKKQYGNKKTTAEKAPKLEMADDDDLPFY